MTSSIVHGWPPWHSLTCQGMLGFVRFALNWVNQQKGKGNLCTGILGFNLGLGKLGKEGNWVAGKFNLVINGWFDGLG